MSNVAQTAEEILPDEPNVWSKQQPRGGFYQRWLPGAFGDRERIDDVFGFTVLGADWTVDDNGVVWRTIKRAEVVSLKHEML